MANTQTKVRIKSTYMKKSLGDKVFDIFNILLFALLSFSFIYPFINVVVVSLNDPYDAMKGGLYFWPRVFSVDHYTQVLTDPKIYTGYAVTVARTVVGAVTHMFCTSIFAYGLSKKNLLFRKTYTVIGIIPMFFGGGLIPTYILLRSLNLLNTFWVYIIPGLIGMWNAMIFKTFYLGIPSSLEEAAKIDGCSDFGVFFKIILPLAKPCIAAILLFKGVEHWNAWFDAYIYVTDDALMPLQTVLMRIINQSGAAQDAAKAMQMNVVYSGDETKSAITPESIRYATMVVSIGPIVLIYPFLQKYFEKGVMIGSVKE